jgi:broad specificity phosphatase PhoE
VQVAHNKKKGFNAAAKSTARNPALLHVLFIRHAESSNNVLAEQITKELGINPYGPEGAAEVMAEYDRRRTHDPDLSALGQRQAALLPFHPHLQSLGLESLAKEGRVRVVTSPMQRTILTSLPLLHSLKGPHGTPPHLTATIVADVCEKGGSYKSVRDPATGVATNQAFRGLTRSQFAEKWGNTHDPSALSEEGWWQPTGPGAEDDVAFEARLLRAKAWLAQQAADYAAKTAAAASASSDAALPPDYLLIVSHADFIDAILIKLLRVQAAAKYIFYSGNTSISHVEFEAHPPSAATAGAAGSAELIVRVRGTNIKPVDIDAHELAIHHGAGGTASPSPAATPSPQSNL